MLAVLILEKKHRNIFEEKWSLAEKEWERHDDEIKDEENAVAPKIVPAAVAAPTKNKKQGSYGR